MVRKPAVRTLGARTTAARRVRRERSELEIIPGIGVAMAEDLHRMGITKVAQLRNENPQRLYDDICALDGVKHDRCVLYVFRCAVYYASKKRHDPEKLKWWNWKDYDGGFEPQAAHPSEARTDAAGRARKELARKKTK
jgi:hypothetical protein